jgi:hypothetical protein
MLNSIFDNGNPKDVSFVLNSSDGRAFNCEALVTNISASVEVGAAHAVSVSFQVSGPINGRF